jgi:N6-adenosine-specific RNA methylase IME4
MMGQRSLRRIARQHSRQRANHIPTAELLLIATRGSCTPDVDKPERQVKQFPRGRHSAKPEEWRALIDRLYPHGPRIELFARGAVPRGWRAWGAEA